MSVAIQQIENGSVAQQKAPAFYRRVDGLTITKKGWGGSPPIYVIRTPNQRVYEFGEEENLLCLLLDGTRGFAEIHAEFKQRFSADLSREQFGNFLAELIACGIIEPVLPGTPPQPRPVALEGARPGADDLDLDDEIEDEFDIDRGHNPELGPERAADRFSISLPNPSSALRVLDWLCAPLRFYRWLLLPAAFLCLIAFITQSPAALSAIAAADAPMIVLVVVAAVAATGVAPPAGQAIAASFYGCCSGHARLSVSRHMRPRLEFDDASWGVTGNQAALRLVATPLLTRLALFAVGTGIWLGTNPSEGRMALFGLGIGQAALWSFLLSAAPFAPTQGRRWLATLFAQPDLWRAGGPYRAHLLFLSTCWLLACAGLVLLYVGLLWSWKVPNLGVAEADALRSIALPLLAIAPAAAWLWLRVMANTHGTARATYRPLAAGAAGQLAALPTSNRGRVVAFEREAVAGIAPARLPVTQSSPVSTPLIVLAAALALLESIAFVPYPYEAGGSFTILPHDSSQLNARVQGELTEVLVNEGDWVQPGQVLGILSDWDERANLAVAKAQLENAKASLQNLYQTPKPEDVELARKQYELAASKLPYDKAQYERYSSLVKTDTVSRSNYDQTLSQYQQDQAAAEVARANYDSVRVGPTEAQIEAARALVRQYTATVAYDEDQLERTRIRATSYGQVVTANPMLLRGQWFNQGQLVFTLQDLRVVQADIQVPETDIGHVAAEGSVRARPWGYPEVTFPGKVIAIAPDAQPDPGGSSTNIIRVRVEIPNTDGRLHPNMDGYAKLTGVYMPSWKAFMQMIERFFLVQVWSWIP